MLCSSWQNTLTTFCPFIISWMKPSAAATDFCWRPKNLAEPPPILLVTNTMAQIPMTRTSVIHTLKYSMIANTTSTTAPDWMSAGMELETSWRRVSMSFV